MKSNMHSYYKFYMQRSIDDAFGSGESPTPTEPSNYEAKNEADGIAEARGASSLQQTQPSSSNTDNSTSTTTNSTITAPTAILSPACPALSIIGPVEDTLNSNIYTADQLKSIKNNPQAKITELIAVKNSSIGTLNLLVTQLNSRVADINKAIFELKNAIHTGNITINDANSEIASFNNITTTATNKLSNILAALDNEVLVAKTKQLLSQITTTQETTSISLPLFFFFPLTYIL